MINVEKGHVNTEDSLSEVATELSFAIVGVFEAINELNEDLALATVKAAISTGAEAIKELYGISLFDGLTTGATTDVKVIKISGDKTIGDLIRDVESFRKKQGAGADAQPTE